MPNKTIKCSKCSSECKETDTFCGECGANLKEEVKENVFIKAIVNLFSTIAELISFLISACIMSAVFAIPIAVYIIGLSESPKGENVFQQIYNFINYSDIALGVGIGVIIGLILTSTLRNKAQLNRIEDKIVEIQKNINKG